MKKDMELKESLKRLKELQAEKGKVCETLEDEIEMKLPAAELPGYLMNPLAQRVALTMPCSSRSGAAGYNN